MGSVTGARLHAPGAGRAKAPVPSFDSIDLFAVPQLHSVSMVAAQGSAQTLFDHGAAGPGPDAAQA